VSPKVEKRGVLGEVQTREERPTTTTTPVAVFTAGKSESGRLPLTGFNTLFQVVLGGLFLMGGGFLLRRTREV
jgi:LPXTG-motif cell wall-anchored protein